MRANELTAHEDPTTCPNGPAIIAAAVAAGIHDAGLVRSAYAGGWCLVSASHNEYLADFVDECGILYGGGSAGWHQIAPKNFVDPALRRAELEASMIRLPNGCKFRVTEEVGHPGSGEPGWALMDVRAPNEATLTAFIDAAKQKFWDVWIRGYEGDRNNIDHAKPGAILFKPVGARAAW